MSNDVRSEVVREILRTLNRMEKTELITKYNSLISCLAISIYGKDIDCGDDLSFDENDIYFLSSNQLNELKNWLSHFPWYVSSMLVGLAKDDENMAWDLAYG